MCHICTYKEVTGVFLKIGFNLLFCTIFYFKKMTANARYGLHKELLLCFCTLFSCIVRLFEIFWIFSGLKAAAILLNICFARKTWLNLLLSFCAVWHIFSLSQVFVAKQILSKLAPALAPFLSYRSYHALKQKNLSHVSKFLEYNPVVWLSVRLSAATAPASFLPASSSSSSSALR